MNWMMDLRRSFFKKVELALDTSAGILITANERLQLPKQRLFLGYVNDSACFRNALPFFVAVYAQQALSNKLDMARSE